MPLKLHTALENYFERFLKQIKWLSEVKWSLTLTFTADGDRESCFVLEKQKIEDKHDDIWQITITHHFFFIHFLPNLLSSNSHPLASPALSCDSYHLSGFHKLALRHVNTSFTPFWTAAHAALQGTAEHTLIGMCSLPSSTYLISQTPTIS